MNTYRLKNRTLSVLTAAALCFATVALTTAQTPAAAAAQPTTPLELQRVTPQWESFALDRIVGKPLRGANQEELSTVEDFLVDPQSGRLAFAVAPSGSNTFRIVPMNALQPSSGAEGLTLTLDRTQWERVGTIVAKRLEGPVTVEADHQARLAQEFGIAAQDVPGVGLVRASTLTGRELRSGSETIGTVEGVVIDFHNKTAAPVVRVRGGLTGAEERFLVPFNHLQLTEGQSAIATTLARNDFLQVQSQPAPTPTGYPSMAQSLQPAVTAIQQSIQGVGASAASVQVIPESRVVLRGTVESEQQKAEIERRAREAAGGTRVDSEITVRRW